MFLKTAVGFTLLNIMAWIIVGLVALYSWLLASHVIWLVNSDNGQFVAWAMVNLVLLMVVGIWAEHEDQKSRYN